MTDDSEPYGRCEQCAVDLPTPAEAREHMSATYDGTVNSSHRVRIVNPTAEQRAECDHELAAGRARHRDDVVAEGRPAQVRLHPEQQHEVTAAGRKRAGGEREGGPLDLADHAVAALVLSRAA